MRSRPIIAYDNVLARDPAPTITHSADAAGFPFANISDWRDYTKWKSSDTGELFVKIDAGAGGAVAASVLALAGHNLASAGVAGIVLSYSDDDISYADCFSPATPAKDGLFMKKFPEVSARFLKFIIPAGYSGTPEVGVLYIGPALEIPAYPGPGFDPDRRSVETAAEHGRTGRLLGIAEGYVKRGLSASFSRLPPSFIDEGFLPFFEAHGALPFFFDWDPDSGGERADLVRLDAPKVEAAYDGPFRKLDLALVGAGGY